MSRNLFDNDEDEDLLLTTNSEYAKSYNAFRKKELLQKYKDRGFDVDESDSSEDSSESTDDEQQTLDPNFDREFFKTLASLKSRDASIYDRNTRFFENVEVGKPSEPGEEGERKEKAPKPMTLKDFERKVILERGGKYEEDSDAEDYGDRHNERAASPTIAEEERRLKDQLKKVVQTEEDSDEEGFGGIFKKREKSKEEKDQEEADYLKWLAGQKEDIEDNVKETLEPLKNYWSNKKLPQSERFLRDYILNSGYSNTAPAEIPTYEEIVGDPAPLSEDEAELERQAEFEHKYNFRYEEPDTDFIKRYPRTIESSVRRTDDKRKEKRHELKERKQREKEDKMRQLEFVKEIKRKEIEEKIRLLKAVTGNEELGFKDEELEEDFDPEAHDRRMNELFNDDYYGVDEPEKPECPSDLEDLKVEDWDNFNVKGGGGGDDDDAEPNCEDEDFNMDCDYDPVAAKQQMQNELIESTRRNRRKRRNRFMEMIQAEKPAFNPDDEKTYADYIDEYYKMDCEDIIGDTPCRFKYVETTPCDFGLTIEEILLAKNKELNQWASLKKAVMIRPEHVEKQEQKLYRMKAKNEELKRKIFKSLYGEESDNEDNKDEEEEKASPSKEESTAPPAADGGEKPKKKRRRKRKANAMENQSTSEAPPAKMEKLDAEASGAVKAEDTQTPKPQSEANEDSKPAATSDVAPETKAKKKKNKKKPLKEGEGASAGVNASESPAKNAANPVKGDDVAKDATPTKGANPSKGPGATKGPNSVKGPIAAKGPNAVKGPNTAKGPNGAKGANAAKGPNAVKGPKGPVSAKGPNAHKGPNPFKKDDKKNENGERQRFVEPRKNEAKGKFNKKNNGKMPKGPGKRFPKAKASDSNEITDERLKAYGINPRKFHKKQKYGKKD